MHPRLRSVTIGSGVDGLNTAGIGLLALFGVPIAAVVGAFIGRALLN